MNKYSYRIVEVPKMICRAIACLFFVIPTLCSAQKSIVMNPNDLQYSGYRHKELPPSFLKRVKATTDTFEPIDGISYAKAVDLYKRDVNPEENLLLWEEMAKAYRSFCKARCTTAVERQDVYRVLLLRSMFDDKETLKRSGLQVLKPTEAQAVMKLYRLPPKPIDVVEIK